MDHENIIVKQHKFDLKKDFPYLTTNSPKICIFKNTEKS